MESSPQDIWQEVVKVLDDKLDRHNLETWIVPIKALELTDSALRLGVPSKFFASWLEEHHVDTMRMALRNITGAALDVEFEILATHEPPPETVSEEEEPEPTAADTPVRRSASGTYLNPKYTFKSFVVGGGNSFAHAAALAVSEKPARAYNPLFIYGGVGLGKTHVMQAIGNFVLDTKLDLRVCYTSAERFMNEMIYSIQHGSTLSFRNKYRGMDVLLIDDVQFLAGKESTQEEFFHTFNSLYDAHKQIVLTSDRAPKEIPNLEERLVSRFEWGLVTDIQPPDFETRVAILRQKAEEENLSLPDGVLHTIADKIKTNIRELEGSLVRLVAYSSFTGQQVTPEMVPEVLKDIFDTRTRTISVDDIKRVVADHYNVTSESLVGRKRTSNIAFARQVAMYLSRMLTDLSLSDIGANFGKRDHTTVIHGCDKISEKAKTDPQFKALLGRLEEDVKQSS
jgi:chromosomal replication initiator protein